MSSGESEKNWRGLAGTPLSLTVMVEPTVAAIAAGVLGLGAGIELTLAGANDALVFNASTAAAARLSVPPPHPVGSEEASAGPSGHSGALTRNLSAWRRERVALPRLASQPRASIMAAQRSR